MEKMPLIDTYRSNVAKKRSELAKLSSDKAKETGKIPPLNTKIINAQKTIGRTSSSATAKSKLGEIQRAQKSLADIEKKIADIDKKIAKKSTEINAEEKKLRQEEERQIKKQEADANRRMQESANQLNSITQAIAQQGMMQSYLATEIENLKYVPEKITVLFFASNPKDSSYLRLDEEVRSIQEMIRKSEHRDSIIFESRWAVRPLDILQAINELNPDVVHFSGHGSQTSDLILENTDGTAKPVSKEAITQTIMAASDKIRLLFFNNCFSHSQAQSVVQYVDAAIGMTAAVLDSGACVFAAQFYSSIGFGLSVKQAFEQAKGSLMLQNPQEEYTPELYAKNGIELDKMFLVKPQ